MPESGVIIQPDPVRIRFIRTDLEGDQPNWQRDIRGHFREVHVPVVYGRDTCFPADVLACQTIEITHVIDLNGRKPASRGEKRKAYKDHDAFYDGHVLTVTVNGSYAEAADFYHQVIKSFRQANEQNDSYTEYTGGPFSPP